ncbi:hypothetical protein DSO57_1020711 [Entomophthora muscae]|uniref:Uncharacterized protein n=1 Tax=Entomophthora muscae TaxID=34485 RepID=A0ACC2TEF4_9FUNG|nr:hypothetical protein DSO57_1020711 [Entomophthora muscae]
MSGRIRRSQGGIENSKADGFFTRIYKNEYVNPQNFQGNLAIAFNSAIFGAAIYVLQNYGDMLFV